MSNVDTFYLKQRTVVGRYLALAIMVLFGIICCGLAGSWILEGDFEAGIIMAIMGLVVFVLALYTRRKMPMGKSFVTLSDEGVNMNNEHIFLWDDIESVNEEEYKQSYEYVSVKKKRLRIRYADRQAGKIKEILLTEDYEGYPFIRERIMRRVAETKSVLQNAS